nr:hypothetical protein [Tanacetum cinerariifolium]
MADVNVENNKDVNMDNKDSEKDVVEDINETMSFLVPKLPKVTSYSMSGGVSEDEVRKLSTSIFVTNFSKKCSAKELWNACKQYGTVVDTFILDRRSKLGKRFGFFRFIKIYDVERLVNNLFTIWIGSFKLHANIARFQRSPPQKNNSQSMKGTEGEIKAPKEVHKENGVNGYSQSYAHVVNSGSQTFHKNEEVLNVEGFESIKIKYMGGFWVMMEFDTETAKEKFKTNVGIPLKVWSKNTFMRITSKWGEPLYRDEQEEGYLHSKRICIRAKEVSGWVPDFDEDEEEEDDSRSNDEVSKEDAFEENVNLDGTSDIEEVAETSFEKEQTYGNRNVDKNSEDSLQYPPGFTPVIPDVHNVSPSDREGEKYSFHGQEDKVDSDAKKTSSSACSGRS